MLLYRISFNYDKLYMFKKVSDNNFFCLYEIFV